ncbi:MAG TPA: GNAT family N-acetyltransferase [Patescibacteria group bacterium]|nr:GNAT family N-acetyltransferase [Patescibacteria group bacterium]
MIQVRRVQPQDLDYIFNNAAALGYKSQLMSGKLDHMMLIIDNKEICGIGFYINIESKCLLNWITIKENHRRIGLGTMLVKTMLNTAEQQGAMQAYYPCECDDFAEFLNFEKIAEEEINDIKKIYSDIYKEIGLNSIYKVSLLDYFKPCNNHHKCK